MVSFSNHPFCLSFSQFVYYVHAQNYYNIKPSMQQIPEQTIISMFVEDSTANDVERISPGSLSDQLKYNRYSSASLDSGRGSDSVKASAPSTFSLLSFTPPLSLNCQLVHFYSSHLASQTVSPYIVANQLAHHRAPRTLMLLNNRLPFLRLPPHLPPSVHLLPLPHPPLPLPLIRISIQIEPYHRPLVLFPITIQLLPLATLRCT